jgi:hypothetical protein
MLVQNISGKPIPIPELRKVLPNTNLHYEIPYAIAKKYKKYLKPIQADPAEITAERQGILRDDSKAPIRKTKAPTELELAQVKTSKADMKQVLSGAYDDGLTKAAVTEVTADNIAELFAKESEGVKEAIIEAEERKAGKVTELIKKAVTNEPRPEDIPAESPDTSDTENSPVSGDEVQTSNENSVEINESKGEASDEAIEAERLSIAAPFTLPPPAICIPPYLSNIPPQNLPTAAIIKFWNRMLLYK